MTDRNRLNITIRSIIMKTNEEIELDKNIKVQKLRFMHLINFYLAIGVFVGLTWFAVQVWNTLIG